MNKISLDTDVATILARLDRSSPDALLKSIAGELLRLHQAYVTVVAKLHAYEVTQTIHDQIASSRETSVFAAMPPSVVIDAAFSLSVECGFYYLEYDVNGAPYRWTGPEPAFFFEVLVDRKVPANLRMHYSQIYSKEVEQFVQCYVDGQEIETTLVEVDGEYQVHGVLPERDVIGGTVITFICPRVSSPAAIGHSQDERQLGLAFRWLRIDPVPTSLSDQNNAHDPSERIATEPKQIPAGRARRRSSPDSSKNSRK